MLEQQLSCSHDTVIEIFNLSCATPVTAAYKEGRGVTTCDERSVKLHQQPHCLATCYTLHPWSVSQQWFNGSNCLQYASNSDSSHLTVASCSAVAALSFSSASSRRLSSALRKLDTSPCRTAHGNAKQRR
jgi:hypothetical protein